MRHCNIKFNYLYTVVIVSCFLILFFSCIKPMEAIASDNSNSKLPILPSWENWSKQSEYHGINDLVELWRVEVEDTIVWFSDAPVINANGDLFQMLKNNSLYAVGNLVSINTNYGVTNWVRENVNIGQSPVIYKDNIYLTAYRKDKDGDYYNHLLAIDSRNQIIWETKIPEFAKTPVIKNDKIFLGTYEEVLCINLDGTIEWKLSDKAKGKHIQFLVPLVDAKSNSYIIKEEMDVKYNDDGVEYNLPMYYLYGIDNDGNVKWIHEFENRYLLGIGKKLSFGTEDTILINDKNDLLAINTKDGSVKWSFKTVNKDLVDNSILSSFFTPAAHGDIAVSRDGTLYAVRISSVTAVDVHTGRYKWSYNLSDTTHTGYSTSLRKPVIDADGNIYIISEVQENNFYKPGDSEYAYIYCFTANGNLKWKNNSFKARDILSLVIGDNNTIYVTFWGQVPNEDRYATYIAAFSDSLKQITENNELLIKVNDSLLQSKTKIINNTIYVQADETLTALGANLEWYPQNKSLRVELEKGFSYFFVGYNIAYINSERTQLGSDILIINNKIFLPIQAVVSIGADIVKDNSNVIHINLK